MSSSEKRPLIFDIHRFALDDGPGIRTTLFLKGCPLACIWCQNPESIESGPEIAFYRHLCIGCGECRDVCPYGAIRLENSDRIDREKCIRCGKCIEACPSMALKSIGRYYPIPEILEILRGDATFFQTSAGGVTFSGGEPTLYMNYSEKVMKGLKHSNIHIAIQTCGMFDMSEFKKKLLPYIDLIFYDIKFIDPELHKRYTGKSNEIILENFVTLIKRPDVRIIPRVPLVPKVTAIRKNIVEIARFLKDAGCSAYSLLPYNPGGISKCISLGKPVHPDLSDQMMGIDKENDCRTIFDQAMRS